MTHGYESAGVPFLIGNRPIGFGHPTFIIAEAGVNHNGRLDLALELVDAAAATGADAVKFQTWQTDLVMTRDAPLAEYQKEHFAGPSQSDMARALELPLEAFGKLQQRAAERGVMFLSTPDDIISAKFLVQLDVPAIKVGSAEVDNLAFLRFLAGFGKPIILSTGMSSLAEVAAAVEVLELGGCRGKIALLHCVSAYPAPPEQVNLRAMETLRAAFGYEVGFSDHTEGCLIPAVAVALGAAIIEKHLTLDRAMQGPDHAASLETAQFAEMVSHIRTIEAALGDARKTPMPSEMGNRTVARRVLVAAGHLRAGRQLEGQDLVAKRAGEGLSAAMLDTIVGRRLHADLVPDQVLRFEHLQ